MKIAAVRIEGDVNNQQFTFKNTSKERNTILTDSEGMQNKEKWGVSQIELNIPLQDDRSIHYQHKKMETQYMSRRIYSQKFKDNIRLHKFNWSDYNSKSEFETPDKIQNNQWKWK